MTACTQILTFGGGGDVPKDFNFATLPKHREEVHTEVSDDDGF
jgi:hypothetical protein